MTPLSLKRCPFCYAKEPTLEMHGKKDINVVCNFRKGGCGASSGYSPTKEKAIALWNRRGKD